MKTYEMKCYPGDEPRIIVSEDFVKRNNFKINQDAVIEIIEGTDDFFGFSKSVAFDYLPLIENTKKYFKDEYLKKIENKEIEHIHITDIYEAAQDFLDYMVFAWMKAMDEKGISASRSIYKLSAWMKILNRSDIADILTKDSLYYPYGRPALKEACKQLGIKYPDYL